MCIAKVKTVSPLDHLEAMKQFSALTLFGSHVAEAFVLRSKIEGENVSESNKVTAVSRSLMNKIINECSMLQCERC